MKTKQRLIVECELEPANRSLIMAELQQMVIDKLTELDSHTVVTLSWEKGREAGWDAGMPDIADGVQQHTLSGRQLEIAMLLFRHFSIRKIANELHISENTVKKHIQNIKRMYGLRSTGLDFLYELQGKLQEEK